MKHQYGTFQNQTGFVWISRLSAAELEVIEKYRRGLKSGLAYLVCVHETKQKAKAHALQILHEGKYIISQSLKGLE